MVRDVFHEGTTVTEACVDRRPQDPFFEYLPDPCGRDLGVRTSSIVARRAIQVIFDDNPKDGEQGPSMYRHTVTVYNGTDASSAYLSSVRAAVRECPTRSFTGWTFKYTIVSSTAQGIELSVRFIAEHPMEQGVPPEAPFRVSIFRSGDRVSVISDVGWEGYPSLDEAVDALVKAAATQLDQWN